MIKTFKTILLVALIAFIGVGTAYADLTIESGETFTLTNGETLTIDGSLIIENEGTLDASATNTNISVTGDWSNAGSLIPGTDSTVTFIDNSTTSNITGDTTFNNLTSQTSSKAFIFEANSTQTITNTLTLDGQAQGTEITLESSVAGTRFTLDVTGGDQTVQFVDVQNSNASSNDITANDAINSGNNDDTESSPFWVFANSATITSPAIGETIGQTPTILGYTSDPSTAFTIEGTSGGGTVVVASGTSDDNGNFRVEVGSGTALDLGANSLRPYVGTNVGAPISITVVAAPTTSQVPIITSHVDNDRITSSSFEVSGTAKANTEVHLQVIDTDDNLVLNCGNTTSNATTGAYTVSCDVTGNDVRAGTNTITITTYDGSGDPITTSLAVDVIFTDPFGVVFDSASNNPIENAIVTLYYDNDPGAGRSWIKAIPGTHIDAVDVNPITTGADGFYSYNCIDGDFYIDITATGYTYPTKLSDAELPAGRVIVNPGSRKEVFTVAGAVIEMDHPMDASLALIKIEKDANKKEVVIGDIVTYYVTIENLTSGDVTDVYLEDKIPAGFKYINGKSILDNQIIPDPTGNRPLTFNIGSLTQGETKTLKYQLVVGSGVTFGNYDNKAFAKYSNGTVLSNNATETVKVIPDPNFDLGTVIGKVFHDRNENGIQDPPQTIDGNLIIEEPIPNVSITTETGTVITTDKNGKYHLPSIDPGRHLFRLDERTLPQGAYLTTDKTVIVDITSSLMTKVNFGVILPRSEDNLTQSQDEQKPTFQIFHDRNIPKTRLNVDLLNNELMLKDNELKEKAEFRIFTNYHLFIKNWRLEIFDQDTKRIVKAFEGTKDNIFEPIYWDGKTDNLATNGTISLIRPDKNYYYRLIITSTDGKKDVTKEKEIKIVVYQSLDDETLEKDEEERKKDKESRYNEWLREEDKKDNTAEKNITLSGETIKVSGKNYQKILVIKGGIVQTQIAIPERQSLTAKNLLEGNQKDIVSETEIILPNGEYEIQVQGKDYFKDIADSNIHLKEGQNNAIKNNEDIATKSSNYSSRHIKIGDDYLYFVGLGDAKMGYTFNSGDIEPVQNDDKFKEGFWSEGKLAYYIKGKILGKYLITSSYDNERENKELFKNLDEDKYYPVYGDDSSIDYSDSDTQGNLYLLIEWDKSSVKWGNYNVGFDKTEFSKFSRTLYGGKIDYESLSSTEYGEARTEAVIFRAKAQQKSAHNEFLATGGSLYYLKNKDVIEGSDKVTIEVRDKITGLIVSEKLMSENSDYEMDYKNGRMIFWKPVPMLVESYSIISSELLDGNLVYVVVDYEYEMKDKYDKANVGLRIRQAITDEVLIGTTYVKEEQETSDYELKGIDTTIHLGKDATVVAEYAQTESEAQSSFVSTDGGLSFNELQTSETSKGHAYGIKGDARLFNRLGVSSYYKWIDNDFSTSATSAQQGKELIGFRAVYDITDNTRISLRHDIQSLIEGGNAQTEMQVGAIKTATTLIQFIHNIRKLTLTGEYRRQEVTEKDELSAIQKKMNEDMVALKADYEINEKLEVSLEQQVSIHDESNNQTTVGVTLKPNDKLTLSGKQTFGASGTATDLSATANMNKNLSVTGGYIITKDTNGASQSTASIGTSVSIDEKTKFHSTLGVSQGVDNNKTTSLAIGGTSKINDKTTAQGNVTVTDSTLNEKTTSYSLGTITKLNEELELASTQSFGKSFDGITIEDKSSIIKTKDGKKLEGSFIKKYTDGNDEISSTNIFGLSGDINDRWSAFGNFEEGIVQNHDGSHNNRYAGSFGLGFVDKDKETNEIKLKASSKLELRFDEGIEDTRQYLFYNSIEGNINENTTLFAKANLSQSKNTTAESTQAQFKELIIGTSYRPIKFDWLNYITKYTYLEDDSPLSQSDMNDIEAEKSHILSGEAIMDLTNNFQLSEKLAYKMSKEKVNGFDFTKTSSWLLVNRLNYNFNEDWTISSEYRILSQEQASDQKHGALLEISRNIGNFIQVGVGYNFTDFNDDLSHLDYTSQGPFLRVTSKFYDRSHEEKELDKQRAGEKKKRRHKTEKDIEYTYLKAIEFYEEGFYVASREFFILTDQMSPGYKKTTKYLLELKHKTEKKYETIKASSMRTKSRENIISETLDLIEIN